MSNDLVFSEVGLRQVTCIVRDRQLRLYGHVARLTAKDPAHQILSCRDPRGWTMQRGASTGFMVVSGGNLSEGHGHDGPGVCLGDGQIEVEALPVQGGCSNTQLQCMPA